MKKTFQFYKILLNNLATQSRSVQGRFAMFLLSWFLVFVSALLLLMFVAGFIRPTSKKINDSLRNDINILNLSLNSGIDRLAAQSVNFSKRLSLEIDAFLQKENIRFSDLKNNPELICKLENKLFPIVFNNLQQVPCSGAFFFLDTTMDDKREEQYFSGLQLKLVNVFSTVTLYNKLSLFRGDMLVARNHNISLHLNWHAETSYNLQPIISKLNPKKNPGAKPLFLLSDDIQYPDNGESARQLFYPIFNKKNEIIGVCGFEITNIYAKVMLKLPPQNNYTENAIYALLDKTATGYSGQLSSGGSALKHDLQLEPYKDFMLLTHKNEKYIGLTKPFATGATEHLIFIGIPEARYRSLVHKDLIHISLYLSVLLILGLLASRHLSKRYITPVLKDLKEATAIAVERDMKIEQLKKDGDDLKKKLMDENKNTIKKLTQEKEKTIRNLTLEKNETEKEHQKAAKQIEQLMTSIAEAESRFSETRELVEKLQKQKLEADNKYVQSCKKLEELDLEKRRVEENYKLIQTDLTRIAERKIEEIDAENYQWFKESLETLTEREKEIYDMHIAGKNTKEILEETGITENTLKFHNRNIYGKLGVKSKKELLRYASLMNRIS